MEPLKIERTTFNNILLNQSKIQFIVRLNMNDKVFYLFKDVSIKEGCKLCEPEEMLEC